MGEVWLRINPPTVGLWRATILHPAVPGLNITDVEQWRARGGSFVPLCETDRKTCCEGEGRAEEREGGKKPEVGEINMFNLNLIPSCKGE